MRRIFIASAAGLVFAFLLWAAIAVGAGAPTAAIQQSFINAYNRGLFSLKVTAPSSNVMALGSPGLVQEFTAAGSTTLKCALVKPDPNAPVAQFDTLQMLSDLYTYYSSVGVSAAGYPTIDTTACPMNTSGTCDYQLFTKDYALFVYSAPTTASYSVADPFYTVWNTGGGIAGSFGVVTTSQTSVTSPFSKTAGTQQSFLTGTIFSYPASSTTPAVYGIVEPVFDVFGNNGGSAALGFPTSSAFQVNSTGLMRQTFENGRIEWTAGNPPAVLFPVSEVDITYANQGLALAAPGATATIGATTLDTNGTSVTGRTLSWSTTNGAVATVAGNGYSAVVTAVGGGTAKIYVTSEGKTSAPLTVTVGTVCCSIGQGAPTQAITQAFQAAVSRNQLAVALPAASPVTRVGTGYIQTLTAANGSGTTWVVAEADGAASAYILTGTLYVAYLANGGFTGSLGYPISDPLPGPVQMFASGAALAGSPALVVAAPVAGKWLALGGISGAAGAPVMAAASFVSYTGVTGVAQGFSNGGIYGITSGALSGKGFFSSGLIWARYLALSGTASALGAPTSDIATSPTGVTIETFEGGTIDLQPGAAAAVEHYTPRTPALTVTPAVVAPGGKVHVSATGFTPGGTLAFTITGQPGFSVPSSAGTFAWDIVVPASAKPGTVSIQTTSPGTASSVSASYTVTSVAALLPALSIVSGDRQTGTPGALLGLPIVAVLQDSSGNPLPGVPVVASASPGAAVQTPAVTDASGRVSVLFRLPQAAGVAVGSVSAGGQTAEFSALAAANTIGHFPSLTASGQQTALVAALASLLQYFQNAGTLSSPNSLATPAALTQYLTGGNGFVLSDTGDAIANPWVAAQFAGAALTVETATLDHVRDLLSAGTPVILNLNLTINGGPAGGTSVDAIGVNADGSIAIFDPNPALARSSLADYLNGFTAQGNSVTGVLSSVFSVAAASPAPGSAAFTVASVIGEGASTSALTGACSSVDLMGSSGSGVRFQRCDGTQALYETDFAVNGGATVTDLTGGAPATIPAGGGLSWSITRSNGKLTVQALAPSIGAVADSAGFGPAVSPGGLFSIFGSGFSGSPVVTVGGKSAPVLAAFPFQINAAMPAGTPVGIAALQVTSAAGLASANISVSAVSPGIFMAGQQGAILNSDGTLNGPGSPAMRGQFVSIYCSGLGATNLKAGLQTVSAVTSVVINGTAAAPSFAGLVAGFVGLYQVNVTIPPGVTPSLSGTLWVQQGTQVSNSVPIAVD